MLMTGCGFQMRGPVVLPYKTIYISGSMTADLKIYLSRLLKTGLTNTTQVLSPDKAELILNVIETTGKQILTYDANGNITGYRLIDKVGFTVKDKEGDELIGLSELFLTRDMDFSIGSPAAGENLELLLFNDMRQDMSAQILRRLSALANKKPIIE